MCVGVTSLRDVVLTHAVCLTAMEIDTMASGGVCGTCGTSGKH